MKNPAKHSPEPFSSGRPVELPLNERRVLRRPFLSDALRQTGYKDKPKFNGDLHGLFASCAFIVDHPVRTWRRAVPSLECRRKVAADEVEEIDLAFFALREGTT